MSISSTEFRPNSMVWNPCWVWTSWDQIVLAYEFAYSFDLVDSLHVRDINSAALLILFLVFIRALDCWLFCGFYMISLWWLRFSIMVSKIHRHESIYYQNFPIYYLIPLLTPLWIHRQYACPYALYSWLNFQMYRHSPLWHVYVRKHDQIFNWSSWSLQLSFYLYNSVLINLLRSCNYLVCLSHEALCSDLPLYV